MDSLIEVTTAADDQLLATLEQAREEIGDESVSDDTLLRWLSVASDRVANYCNRVFLQETVTETFNLRLCDRPQALLLRRTPVQSITSVTVDDADLDAVGFECDNPPGLLRRLQSSKRSPWSGGRIVVVYDGGYPTVDDLPPSLTEAALSLVRMRWSATKRDPMLRSLEIPGVSTETWWVGTPGSGDDPGIPPEVASLLSRYRRIEV